LLRLLGKKNQDWDEVLPSALWALRKTNNTTTSHSSFELVYGREDQQPYYIAIGTIENTGKYYDEISWKNLFDTTNTLENHVKM